MASIVEILINIKDNASAGLASLANAMSGASDAGSGLSSTLKTVTEVIGAAALGAAVTASVEVWAKWQQSVVELNAALSLTGQYSEAASAQIQGMAEYIQNVTSVSKQSALGVSEMAAAFTHLQPTQLAELQKAAVGFQAVFGGGMEHAASLFSRSLEGSGIVLRRYGVDIDSTMSESERFSAIMSRFGPMFQVAVSGADTLAGRFEQMKNQFQDLERTVGDLVTRILGLQGGIEGTKGVVERANEWIKDHGDILVAYGTRFVAAMTALIELVPALFLVVIDKVAPLFETVKGWIDKIEELLAKSSKAILDATQGAGPKLVITADTTPAEKHIAELETKFQNLVKLLMTPVEVSPVRRLGTVETGKGAEENLPTAIVKASDTTIISGMISQQKELTERVHEGSLTYQDYLYYINKVRDTMVVQLAAMRAHKEALVDEEKTGKDNNLAIQGTEVQINRLVVALKSLGLEGDPNVKSLTASIKDLDEQYKTGVITLGAYETAKQKLIDQIKAEIAADVALLTSLTLTKDQSDALTKSIAALRGELDKLEKAGATAGERIFRAFAGSGGITEAAEAAKRSFKELGEETITAGTAAAGAALASGKNVGAALKEVARTESAHAFAKALEYLAEALAATVISPGQAGGLFAASAEMFAAGEAFKLIGGGGGGGGGAGGGGGGGGGASAQQTSNSVQGLAQGGFTLVIPAGLTNSPRFYDELMGAIEQAGIRGIHVATQG